MPSAKTPEQQAQEAQTRLDALDKVDMDAAAVVMSRLAGKPLQLAAKLADIATIAERIPKRGTAPAAMGGYGFVQVGDAADFIRKALGRRHITMAPTDVRVDHRNEHATSRGGIMTTVELLTVWTLTDGDTGETSTIMSYGAGSDTGDKFSGKAMTSAMKYALLSGFQLSTGDDTELNDATDKIMSAPTVESRAGQVPAAGGRQQGVTQPQSKVIGDLLRAAHASTTEKAIILLSQLTGKTIEPGTDANAALATFLKDGLTANERGKLVHDLQKHIEGLKEAPATPPAGPANGADSSPTAPAGEEPASELEADAEA